MCCLAVGTASVQEELIRVRDERNELGARERAFLIEDRDFREGPTISEAGRMAGRAAGRAVPQQGVYLSLTAAMPFACRAQQGSMLQL